MNDGLEKDCCHEEVVYDVEAGDHQPADEALTDEKQSQLKDQLIKAEEERDQYLSMAQRLQAEFDNFRKRNRAAVSEAYEEAAFETVEKFLPVLDNLQRALESSKDNDSSQAEAICKGVEMVIKQFLDIMAKMGIEEIEALGKPFDPTYHDAVMQVEAGEDQEKNTVVEVLLKGYKAKDKVIRYSMVKVAN
ncbi:MAG: nucleotide exchange factor GrpE [Clostridiales bacterium]|nr:nucleotide exchange factor GrpE [Clostridiales bacterium]